MKKVAVAICDADKMEQTVISGAVRSAFETNGVEARIRLFSDTETLREEMRSAPVQLIMTDIDLPNLDGIELGRQLRALGSKADIIYVSDREDRVFEALEVQPFGFVRKSNFLKDLSDAVCRYVGSKSVPAPFQSMDLPTRSNGRIHISVERIMYFEGDGMYQQMFLQDGTREEIASRMDHLEKTLQDHGFMRMHKGYLVNYRFITRLDKTDATLTDGKRIPISRRKAKEIRQRYLQLGKNQGVLLF